MRGNAQTIYEKYQQLARDANSSGDRVLAENHLQHAEHYFRMIRQMQPQRPVSEFVQRDPFSSGFDLDYDDDGENEGGEAETEVTVTGEEAQPGLDEPRYDNRMSGERTNGERNGRDNRNNGNNGYNNRDRDGRNNRDRQNGEQRSFEPRHNNNGGNRQNNDRPNGDRMNGEAAERVEYDENGNRRETRRERYERRRMQRLSEQEQNLNGAAPAAPGFIASTEPLGAPARAPQPVTGVADLAFEPAPSEQPVVRERPRKDADHLPAFIRKPAPVAAEPAPAAAEAEPDAKPKRGRPKRKAEDVGAAEEA